MRPRFRFVWVPVSLRQLWHGPWAIGESLRWLALTRCILDRPLVAEQSGGVERDTDYWRDATSLYYFLLRDPDGDVLLEDCRTGERIPMADRDFKKLTPVFPLQKGTKGLVRSAA